MEPDDFQRKKEELQANTKPFNLMREAGVKDVRIAWDAIDSDWPKKQTTPYRDRDCALVIAMHDDDEGFVLETSAFGSIEADMDGMSPFISDLELPTTPGPGLWIWEGEVRVYGGVYGGGHYEYDFEVEYEGSYRRLTPDELSRLNEGKRIWLPLNRMLLKSIPREQAQHVLREWSLKPNTEQNRDEWAEFEKWLKEQYPA